MDYPAVRLFSSKENMRIGIDARVIERRMSGIGRYLLGLLKYLPEIDKKNQYFLFCYNNLSQLENKGFRIITTGKTLPLPSKVYNLYWLQHVLPQLLKKLKIDIFFNANHYLPLRDISSKSIITIHDLSYKVEKSYKSFIYRGFYLNFLLPQSLKKADFILTVSQNSKRDILKYYSNRVSANKIEVIYEATDERFQPRDLNKGKKEELRRTYNLPENFVLYVGRIENRKNIVGILKIGDLLLKKGKEIKIVLVGESGYSGYKELKKEIRKRKNIFHIQYIRDEDLPYIYNLAKVFLFPSFYEGFGLPPLEAMQSGVPVLTSNTSSLPEVIGEGGIMHNPNNYEGFTKDIIRLLEDKNFYKKMREKAIEQAKKFSWKKSTKRLISIFNQI